MYIPLGGSCFFGTCIRKKLKLHEKSLPFDYIRSHFSYVIKCIENNFNDFLPKNLDNPDIIVGDLIIYNNNDHCFYHHDFRNNLEMVNSFNRRIERFKNYLETQECIYFFRSITDIKIANELNLRYQFYKIVKQKYPNLKFKLIFVGHRHDDNIDNIYYEQLDDNACIFTVGIKPTIINNCVNFDINLEILYSQIILFIKQHNFFDIKLKINSNNLEYINYDFTDSYEYNAFCLDTYP